jgi:phosphoglycerate dehydrogenase-like enzyme
MDQREGIVLAASAVPEELAFDLRRFGEVVCVAPEDSAAWSKSVEHAIAIIARGNTRISRELIESAPHLRVIARSGVGVDLIDVGAATEHGIPVVITPGAGSTAVAEGAVALMLALVKRLKTLDSLVRDGRWTDRESVPVGDLDGATLCVVGFGRIGRRLAEFGLAFGMSVRAVDPPAQRLGSTIPDGVTWATLAQALPVADVVSLHLPLDDSTRGILDLDGLLSMKPGATLLNLGRGALVSSYDDLFYALDAVPLNGVGLDTFVVEPPNHEHPLFKHERVQLTPHVLGLSRRARHQIFKDMVASTIRVLEGQRVSEVANPAVWASAQELGSSRAKPPG